MKTKNTQISNPGLYYLFTILIGLAVLFPSCKKDSLDLTGTANVMIVNSAEGSLSQDFFLNNAKLNSSAVAYAQNSSYLSTSAGSGKTAEFRNTGSATANATANVTLESDKYYTFYYTGSGSSTSEVKTEDDMSAPPSGKAKVRYINLNASGSTNVDFALNGTNIGSNLAYKSVSSFSTVDAGTSTFNVLAAGTSTLQFAVPVTLQAGKIYTIWASGNTVLTSHVLVHN